MKRYHLTVYILFILLLPFAQGCTLFQEKETPLPGYNTGEDVYEEFLEEDFHTIWAAALHVLENEGLITYREPGVGRIEADIERDHVVFRLFQVRKDFAQIRVQAYQRRTFTPHVARAERILQNIKKKINE